MAYKENVIQPGLMPLSAFKTLLDKLEFDQNEVFAFKNDPIAIMYQRPIKQLDHFYFKKSSKNYFD